MIGRYLITYFGEVDKFVFNYEKIINFFILILEVFYWLIKNMSEVETLQTKFGKENQIIFSEGKEGLTKVNLNHKSGSTLEVYLKGAHVTSFKTSKNEELLFISSKTLYAKKAIRGGIPVIFPQFGPNGPLIQHGFGRNVNWQVKETQVKENEISLILNLHQNEETLSIWNNHFNVDYKLILNNSDSFQMDFQVTNINQEKNFSFTTALHTYFNVSDIKKTEIKGLKGLIYDDKILKKQIKETNDSITFDGEMDTVYYKSTEDLEIECEGKRTGISLKGFDDCVVWNPWNKSMGDMGENDWTRMVCVEVAKIGIPVDLKAGESWTGTQIIKRL